MYSMLIAHDSYHKLNATVVLLLIHTGVTLLPTYDPLLLM